MNLFFDSVLTVQGLCSIFSDFLYLKIWKKSSNKDRTVLFFPLQAKTRLSVHFCLNKIVIKLTVLLGCKVRKENYLFCKTSRELVAQYSQSNLPPLRLTCGEAPGRDSNLRPYLGNIFRYRSFNSNATDYFGEDGENIKKIDKYEDNISFVKNFMAIHISMQSTRKPISMIQEKTIIL